MKKEDFYNFFTRRWYDLYVNGCGSSLMCDERELTLKQARKKADHWIGYSDTVGGDSQIRNRYTGKIVPIYPKPLTQKEIVWKIKQPFRLLLKKLLQILG